MGHPVHAAHDRPNARHSNTEKCRNVPLHQCPYLCMVVNPFGFVQHKKSIHRPNFIFKFKSIIDDLLKIVILLNKNCDLDRFLHKKTWQN